jgi:hypothetical protein
MPSLQRIAARLCLVASALSAAASLGAQDRPLREIVDEQVRAAWERETIAPADRASDAEFLRRVYLDLVGVIPTHEEARSFLDDPVGDKREQLIDRLLADPRFARHQAEIWDLALFGRDPPGYGTDRREGIQAWLQKQFADNVRYDQWAKALLRAEGNSVDDGPAMYYVQYNRQPENATEAITQTFLGAQLQCARCHDHPYEPWKQAEFYGMAAFLARLEVVTVGKSGQVNKYAIGEKSSGDLLFSGSAKDQQPGKKGDPVRPKFLHGPDLEEPPLPESFKEVKFQDNQPPPAPQFSRKNALADWITSRENPYFARAIANRIWAQFMGRGLVHPVDNMSESNNPSHPELLDAISKALVELNFDLKWLMRELVSSKTYQLSSAGGSEEPMPPWFERARVRPLSAEELADSWRTAVRYEAVLAASGKKPSGGRFSPLEGGYVLRFFGKPTTGVGDFQGGLQEHLYLNNGGLSSLMTSSKGSLHHALSSSESPWEERVDELFLSVLSRRPSEKERARFVEFLSTKEGASERLQEAIWSLMTCSEFRFNH